MSSLIQLDDPIEVETPLGHGYAVLVEVDQLDQWWTVILDTRAFVTFTQNKIRAIRSYSWSRGISDDEMKRIVK